MLRVEIFVPIDADEDAAEELQEALIEKAGGLTVTQGTGYWENAEGEIVVECVDLYLCFMPDTDENRLEVEGFCREFKEDSGEEAVLYVLNGTGYNLITD